jgi:hypothetical protein
MDLVLFLMMRRWGEIVRKGFGDSLRLFEAPALRARWGWKNKGKNGLAVVAAHPAQTRGRMGLTAFVAGLERIQKRCTRSSLAHVGFFLRKNPVQLTFSLGIATLDSL